MTKAEAIAVGDVRALIRSLRGELATNSGNIPAELKELKGWLAYRVTEINPETGKFNKVPVYPCNGELRNGPQGGESDLENLGTWGDAMAALKRDKSLAGVGFATLSVFGIVALDVDHCIENGVIRSDAYTLSEESYCEISPSGNGIRAFWLGEAYGGQEHTAGFELFHSKGFVTITGNQVENNHYLVSNALPSLPSDLRVTLEKLCNSRVPTDNEVAGCEKKDEVMEVSPETLADLRSALMSMSSDDRELWMKMGLALKELGVPGYELWLDWSRTSSKFRPSKDPKAWKSFKPHSIGYQSVFTEAQQKGWINPRRHNSQICDIESEFESLDEAGDESRDTASPKRRFALKTADEIVKLPAMQWVVKNVLPVSGIGAIFGPSASGKSFLALDLFGAITDCREWFGHKVTTAPVIYVCLEGEGGLSKRMKAYRTKYGDDSGAGIRFVTANFHLLDGAHVKELAEVILEAGSHGSVIAIDTLNRSMPGADENSSQDIGRAIAACAALQRYLHGVVILIHHTGKDSSRGMRGHSSLFAALDFAIEVKRDNGGRSWEIAKSKDGEDGRRFAFDLNTVGVGADEDMEIIESCVIVPGVLAAPQQQRMTSKQQQGVQTLKDACVRYGTKDADDDWSVDVEEWRKVFYETSTADTPDAKKKAFQRMRDALVSIEKLSVKDGRYKPLGLTTQTGISTEKYWRDNGTGRDIGETCPDDETDRRDRTGHTTIGVSHVPLGREAVM